MATSPPNITGRLLSRQPSGGIGQPQPNRFSSTFTRDSNTSDSFSENPGHLGNGRLGRQQNGDAVLSSRFLHGQNSRGSGDARPREERAPPRYDSFRRPLIHANTGASQRRQNQTNTFRPNRNDPVELVEENPHYFDDLLFYSEENLYEPEYQQEQQQLQHSEAESGGRFQLPLGLDPNPPSRNGQEPGLNDPLLSEDVDFGTLCNMVRKLEMNRELTEEDYVIHDQSWDPVRDWLEQHSIRDLQIAMEARDIKGQTAMHYVCQHQPPLDIVTWILQHCPSSLESTDMHGWSPLHFVCFHSAPPLVLQIIAETCKLAKTAQTLTGLTPLHLALYGPFRDYADIIAILASTGAAQIPQHEGMLPLHFACAYGASEETIRLLIDCFPPALLSPDKRGHDPLNCALANTVKIPKQVPKIVPLLLNIASSHAPGQNLVNAREGRKNPFEVLTFLASEIRDKQENQEACDAIKECLMVLLATRPDPTPTVLSTLRTLPPWLFPTAILSSEVQDILNEKIKDKYPTMILIFDLYMQIMILVCFHQAIPSQAAEEKIKSGELASFRSFAWPLIIGGGYFLLRELMQVLALIRLRSFRTFLREWILHVSDWLDILYIVAVLCCGTVILQKESLTNDDAFETIAVFSAGIFWAKLFGGLRSISIDFSVFVSGLVYVSRSLLPYVAGLALFLVAFSQMFQTMYRTDSEYGCTASERSWPRGRRRGSNETEWMEMIENLQCGNFDDFKPFCNKWDSFLHVYTMFLGEIDEADFQIGGAQTVAVGTTMYALFVFLMVILLANVLIAIVTDSYKFIQDSEAALVFYTNRLYFLAETDAISNFLFLNGCLSYDQGFDDWARLTWDNLFAIFEFRSEDYRLAKVHWSGSIVPLVITGIAIPTWILIGFATCGGLWPPQIRLWIFTSKTRRKYSTAHEEQSRQKDRRKNEEQIANEVAIARDEFYRCLSENRQHHSQIKASMIERKHEIKGEMRRILVLVNNLFEEVEQLRADRAVLQSDSDSESY